MKKTLTRDTLEEILSGAGLDAEDVVYSWPSGMYGGYGGHNSFALTADVAQLAQFFKVLGGMLRQAEIQPDHWEYAEGDTLEELTPSGTDALGLWTVTYFRGWELEPEEDGA